MQTLYLILLLLIILPIAATAQVEVQGKVTDTQVNGLELATVILRKSTDTTSLFWTTSLQSGRFTITVEEAARYYVEVRLIGFTTYRDTLLVQANNPAVVFQLVEDKSQLQELEIVAEKSYVENGLGKKVLIVGEDLSTAGSTVAEVMLRIPSVSSTANGAIQLRGSSNFVIYINGKETRRKPNSLRFLPAESIERIEVITTPSAQYDSEGAAGIINIIFKKDAKKPLKMDVAANLIFPTRRLLALNTSVNSSRLSAYANVSRNWGDAKTSSAISRTGGTGELTAYSSTTDGSGSFENYSVDTGLNYHLDSTANLELSINFNRWDDTDLARQLNSLSFSNTTLREVFISETSRSELEDELALALSFDKKFRSSSALKVLLTAGGENETNFSRLSPIVKGDVPAVLDNLVETFDGDEQQRLYQAKSDFETSLPTLGLLKAGVKADLRKYDLDQYIDFLADSVFVPDNLFQVTQQKLGLYLLFENNYKKWDYAYGLRYEAFESRGLQTTSGDRSNQTTSRFFPYLQLSYASADKSHSLGLSFSQRINQPSFFRVNPYISYSDPLNLSTGNPTLQPEVITILEGSYQWAADKISVDVTGFHRITSNVIQSTVQLLEDEITLETFANFNERNDWGSELLVEYNQSRWLTLLLSGNYRFSSFGSPETFMAFENGHFWSFRCNQQITIGNKWLVDLAQNYNGAGFEPQRKRLPRYYATMSLSRKFNNNRGSFSINLQDIFDTNEFGGILYSEGLQVENIYKYQTRRLTFGIRYSII